MIVDFFERKHLLSLEVEARVTQIKCAFEMCLRHLGKRTTLTFGGSTYQWKSWTPALQVWITQFQYLKIKAYLFVGKPNLVMLETSWTVILSAYSECSRPCFLHNILFQKLIQWNYNLVIFLTKNRPRRAKSYKEILA